MRILYIIVAAVIIVFLLWQYRNEIKDFNREIEQEKQEQERNIFFEDPNDKHIC